MTAAAAATADWRLPPKGRVAMGALIVAESAVFVIFVVAYLYYLGKSTSGPTPKEVLDLPTVATICLLSSSATITLAERALRRGRTAGFLAAWLATIALAVTFLFCTASEWNELIFEKGLTIRTNLFGTTFYSLVGLHAFHVVAGVTALLTVAALALTGRVHQEHAERVEVLGLYWHFVDAVWVVVFLVVYVFGRSS